MGRPRPGGGRNRWRRVPALSADVFNPLRSCKDPLAVWRFVGLCVLVGLYEMCMGQGEPRGKRQGNASKHKEPLAVWRFVGLCILFGMYRLFVGQGEPRGKRPGKGSKRKGKLPGKRSVKRPEKRSVQRSVNPGKRKRKRKPPGRRPGVGPEQPPKLSATAQVFVRTDAGERCVELSLGWTVADAKAAILSQCAPPGARPCSTSFWIRFSGKALMDSQTLESAGVRAGSNLSLEVRVRGGGGGGGGCVGKQTHAVAPSSAPADASPVTAYSFSTPVASTLLPVAEPRVEEGVGAEGASAKETAARAADDALDTALLPIAKPAEPRVEEGLGAEDASAKEADARAAEIALGAPPLPAAEPAEPLVGEGVDAEDATAQEDDAEAAEDAARAQKVKEAEAAALQARAGRLERIAAATEQTAAASASAKTPLRERVGLTTPRHERDAWTQAEAPVDVHAKDRNEAMDMKILRGEIDGAVREVVLREVKSIVSFLLSSTFTDTVRACAIVCCARHAAFVLLCCLITSVLRTFCATLHSLHHILCCSVHSVHRHQPAVKAGIQIPDVELAGVGAQPAHRRRGAVPASLRAEARLRVPASRDALGHPRRRQQLAHDVGDLYGGAGALPAREPGVQLRLPRVRASLFSFSFCLGSSCCVGPRRVRLVLLARRLVLCAHAARLRVWWLHARD